MREDRPEEVAKPAPPPPTRVVRFKEPSSPPPAVPQPRWDRRWIIGGGVALAAIALVIRLLS